MDAPTRIPISTIRLEGELEEALKRDGEFVWSAVKVQCMDAKGKEICRIPLTGVVGSYEMPVGTKSIGLWIGDELGGAGWWREWWTDSADALQPEIVLRILRVPTPTPEK